MDFYEKHDQNDLKFEYYANKERDSPLDVFLIDGLPQQTYWYKIFYFL